VPNVFELPGAGNQGKGGKPGLLEHISSRRKAVVIHPEHKRGSDQNTPVLRDAESCLEEACGLALAIDLEIIASQVIHLNKWRPATILGQGKIEELADLIKAKEAEVLIVNAHVTPVQQRNLERTIGTKVIDRTGLILEIFGERARTKEGVLQVELAHLSYQQSRLVRTWTHLERQRGGFGFMGGPGETQIETDRRLIRDRISKLKKQLVDVKRTRTLHRKERQKVPYPVVALIGYTNAGKSTLFNRLTASQVQAEDMLFATLDPTLRMVRTPAGRQVILSDTVGFISDLPTQLVAAFHATLEEVTEADLLLHVHDCHHVEMEAQAADVKHVLQELGLNITQNDAVDHKASLNVYNKTDLLDQEATKLLQIKTQRKPESNIAISAVTGEGCQDLLARIDHFLDQRERIYRITFPAQEGSTHAWLHEVGTVLNTSFDEDNQYILDVRLDSRHFGQLKKRKNIQIRPL
jgi:GTP-binding protein HflX